MLATLKPKTGHFLGVWRAPPHPSPHLPARRASRADIGRLIDARVRERLPMGCCMSMCESTPDVPVNIIADPEVRAWRERFERARARERERER